MLPTQEQFNEFSRAYDRMVEICNLTAILLRYQGELKAKPKDKTIKFKTEHYRKTILRLMDEEEEKQNEYHLKRKLKRAS